MTVETFIRGMTAASFLVGNDVDERIRVRDSDGTRLTADECLSREIRGASFVTDPDSKQQVIEVYC